MTASRKRCDPSLARLPAGSKPRLLGGSSCRCRVARALALAPGVKIREISGHSLLVRKGFLLPTAAHAKHGGVTPALRLTWPRILSRRGSRRLLSVPVGALLRLCRCLVRFGRCFFAAAPPPHSMVNGQRGKRAGHAQHRARAAQAYAAGILVLPAQRLAAQDSSRMPARRW